MKGPRAQSNFGCGQHGLQPGKTDATLQGA